MDFMNAQHEILPVGHLPVVRGLMEQLGILETIDEHCPKRRGARVSDAECVGAMALNILSGRVALYRMEQWFAETDAELLLGEGVASNAFNDTRLATALDHLDEAGTDRILGDVVARYLAQENRPTCYSIHQDFTSISLWGVYRDGGEPLPTYGFSKDHRPDLKQLVFGLTLHGAAGIPLVHSVSAGNTSDSTANRNHLAELAKMLPGSDEVTVVADCKLVDADTLGQVLGAGFHVVSLLPDSYKLRGELIDQAWLDEPSVESWGELARQPGPRKSASPKVYRGRSYIRPMKVRLRAGGATKAKPVDSVETMRFLVVHSTRLAEKFDKSLPDKMTREIKRLEAFEKKVNRKGFACEADALAAADAELRKVRLHSVDAVAHSGVRTLKRARRGRPRKDDLPQTETVWTLSLQAQPDTDRIAQTRRRKSCFVLITDHMERDGWDDARVLAEYRHQYMIEGHTGFRWLKGEAAVAPMFLKTPTRMRAMGLVMVLALMVRNYFQFTLRATLRDRGETLPHPFTKKQVNNLTTEMAFEHFSSTLSVRWLQSDRLSTRTPPRLCDPAIKILELLGLSFDLFYTPPPRRVPPDPSRRKGRHRR